MSEVKDEVKISKSQWKKLLESVEEGVGSEFVDSSLAESANDVTEILTQLPKTVREYLLDKDPREWTSKESKKFLQNLGIFLWTYIRPRSEDCAFKEEE